MGAPIIFDRGLVARRLRRRTAKDDFVSRLVLDDLAERLLAVTRSFERALIMAPDPGILPDTGRTAEGAFSYERAGTVLGGLDPEALVLPASGYDLIVSVLDLTIVNDVPGFLARVRAHLGADGLFMAAVLGGDTLSELRQAFLAADAEVSGGAYARVAPFLPLADAGPLLQRTGFALPVTDIETHRVRYADALSLMREIKALGASNPLLDRPSKMAPKTLIAAAAASYPTDPDDRVPATLEIVWLSGWAPHESQQKPLRPGSAEISLTKVLGAKG